MYNRYVLVSGELGWVSSCYVYSQQSMMIYRADVGFPMVLVFYMSHRIPLTSTIITFPLESLASKPLSKQTYSSAPRTFIPKQHRNNPLKLKEIQRCFLPKPSLCFLPHCLLYITKLRSQMEIVCKIKKVPCRASIDGLGVKFSEIKGERCLFSISLCIQVFI